MVGTPNDIGGVVALRKKLEETEPELTEYERSFIGGAARIDVPLEDIVSLEFIGKELETLGRKIGNLRHMKGRERKSILWEARQEILISAQRIKRKVYGGKLRSSRKKFEWEGS